MGRGEQYILQGLSGSGAAARLGQIQGHMATTIRIDPASSKVNVEFNWADGGVAAGNRCRGAEGAADSEGDALGRP